MTRLRRFAHPHAAPVLLWAGLALVGGAVAARQPPQIAVWRAQHERQIVDELLELVSIPNVAGNDAEMRRNADLLEKLFSRRGFRVEQTTGPGSPVILASLDVPSARGVITFYIHYDG